MTAHLTTSNLLPAEAVRALVARHGFWRMLRAVVAAALPQRPPVEVRRLADLSDHLRRDVGLPPLGPHDRTRGHE